MRIIAGKHKGLKLKTFTNKSVRPTPDKVRQALFNTLQFDIKGSSFLDLFGGTGGISLEALSRGAGTVVTVEVDGQNAKLIKSNFKTAGEECQLYTTDWRTAVQLLAQKEMRFRFIYLDPPFHPEILPAVLQVLASGHILENDSLIICEHDSNTPPSLPEGLVLENQKKYGNVSLSYIRQSHV